MRRSAQVKGPPAVDRDSVSHHLVGLRFVALRLEGVGVGRVGVKGECALDRERDVLVRPMRRGEEGSCATPSANGYRARDGSAPGQGPAVTVTAPVPVAEPVGFAATKVTEVTVVPAV